LRCAGAHEFQGGSVFCVYQSRCAFIQAAHALRQALGIPDWLFFCVWASHAVTFIRAALARASTNFGVAVFCVWANHAVHSSRSHLRRAGPH
jgi:hypothetical protein